MRIILLAALLFLLCAFAEAQTASKINLRNLGAGKISVSRGKLRAIINLTEETAGCVFPSGAGRRESDRRGCTASPAEFKLIDAVQKDGQTFLVVLSEASGNCNVCGQCGATEAFALIWLKLDARLRATDKNSVPVEYCLANVTLVSPALSEDDYINGASLKFTFNDDLLRVAYEEGEFKENNERIYLFSTLEYNRKTPEKGFVIKTEKRDKSADEQ